MADPTPPICFECGQDASAMARLNCLPDGRPCATCADRLLARLSPALPGSHPEQECDAPDAREASFERDGDYDMPA